MPGELPVLDLVATTVVAADSISDTGAVELGVKFRSDVAG